MSKYHVGQVLFVIDSEKNAVLPCQVVEEVTKKTLEGDAVMYKVIFGIDKNNVMDLSRVKGEIYTSLNEVKRVLLSNVTKWVETHVNKAAKATLAWYKYDALGEQPTQIEESSPEVHRLPEVNLDLPASSEEMVVEIAPGQFAKAKIKVNTGGG